MSLTFEFDLTEREHIRAARILSLRQPTTRRILAFLALCLLVLIAYHGVQSLRGYGAFPLMALAGWAAIALGLAVVYYAPSTTVRSLRKNNRAAAGLHVYDVTERGLEMRAEGASGAIEWPGILEVYESRDFLFFYFSSEWAHFLPKRAVAPATLPMLRESLRRWVGTRAHLRQ